MDLDKLQNNLIFPHVATNFSSVNYQVNSVYIAQ